MILCFQLVSKVKPHLYGHAPKGLQSAHINEVSILSGLIWKKMYDARDQNHCPFVHCDKCVHKVGFN